MLCVIKMVKFKINLFPLQIFNWVTQTKQYFSRLMISLLYLCCLLIFFQITTSNFNSNPMYSNLGHSNANGTKIIISPDESIIAAGFSDGTFKLFGIGVNEMCSNILTNSSSITDLIWLPSFGAITLDMSNTINLWSLDCNITNSIIFTQPVTGITGHQLQGDNQTNIGLIAVNLQNRIQEYDIETGEQTLVYNLQGGQQVLEMVYNLDGEVVVLLVGTDQSVIKKFQIENGTEVDSFQVQSPIEQMEKISVFTGEVVIGIAQNKDIIRFDSAGQVLDRGNFPQSVSITTCPTTKQFALAHTSSQSIGVYLYAGLLQQTISSLSGFPKDIDCSASYLVSIDQKGYINVYTYEEFKSWIIAIIAGVVGGLLFLILVVVVVIRLRKKWAEQNTQQQYKTRPKNKYPRSFQNSTTKHDSAQMLKVNTLQTTMRE